MPDASGASFYDLLGVAPGATDKQIKDAYRRAARASHPDLGGSDELFHSVAVAYETLGNPARRQRYDAGNGTRSPARTAAAWPRPGNAPPRAEAPRTPGTSAGGNAEAAAAPPEYLPPFSPAEPPGVPLILAGRQLHGAPRQPGIFGRMAGAARARVEGESRTSVILEQALLPTYPAARLVNGLKFPNRTETTAGHAVLGGYRIAVLDSFAATPGNFDWDGRTLRHQGRTVQDLGMLNTVREMQDLFPECNVSGWIVVHGARDNPFDPVIDSPPSFDKSAPSVVQVVNAGTMVRTIRSFLTAGPQPNVVQLPVLARLLSAAGN
ncbi:J domain-containing protein [Arthrobacter sp. Br18]|uniref:J domain-containing protein n=1 Tax=Arthrobacter sp. Br18 TaxID=1312954 RepID=UPI000478A895|nr:J domain-containing protein [Arthrobacter sp. Br18]